MSASAATVSVPTGSVTGNNGRITWKCPTGVKVVAVITDMNSLEPCGYVGVTPGKSYSLRGRINFGTDFEDEEGYLWIRNESNQKHWYDEDFDAYGDEGSANLRYTLSWSPEINTHTPDVEDY